MGYSYIYPPLSNSPSGRVADPAQEEFFGSEPISSQNPQSISSEQFQVVAISIFKEINFNII